MASLDMSENFLTSLDHFKQVQTSLNTLKENSYFILTIMNKS
jgi:hypothetical protein